MAGALDLLGDKYLVAHYDRGVKKWRLELYRDPIQAYGSVSELQALNLHSPQFVARIHFLIVDPVTTISCMLSDRG